jgi:hypothetical protein
LNTTAAPSGVADQPSAADSAAPSPPKAPPPTRPVVNEAAVQRAAPLPAAVAASTYSSQSAFVAPQAMPATASANGTAWTEWCQTLVGGLAQVTDARSPRSSHRACGRCGGVAPPMDSR